MIAPVIAVGTRARAAPLIYRPVLRAMSQTGAAALGSGLLGALAAKIIAAVGGRPALATLSTLQPLRQAAVVAATGNGQTALVRCASALGGRERPEYVRTIACLFAAATALVAGSMIQWPQPLAALAGLEPDASRLIPWLALPVALTSFLVFASALLNVPGAIGRLAILSVVAAIGFVAMYAAHLMLGAIYLCRKLRFVPTRGALAGWVLGLAVVMTASALSWGQT